MVKLAYIIPTVFLERFASQGDIHLALAMHLRSYDHPYTAFYRKESATKEIIMDNNVFELGKSAPIEELVEKASWINATYIVSPDALFDGPQTVKNLEEFVDALRKAGSKAKIFAVAQGKDLADWLWCHQELSKHPDVDIIGLSILAIPHAFREMTGTEDISVNRVVAMRYMRDKSLFGGKKYHCLGMGSDVQSELMTMRDCGIYSNDSCSVFQTANIRLQTYLGGYVLEGKPKEKLNFDLEWASKAKQSCVQQNINLTKKWSR